MTPVAVDDARDARLADFAALADPRARRRYEAERNMFVAESPLVVARLLESGRTVRAVLVTPAQYDVLADALATTAAPVYVAPEAVLREVVGFDLHRGAVASAERWSLPAVADLLAPSRRVVVVERVNDHENLGVLFRSAAALGADAVLLDAQCADPFYRRCVRVSIGLVCTLPWTRIAGLDELTDAGFTTYALTPGAGARPLDTIGWAERSAILVGAEGPGLSAAWLRAADERVGIPMQRDVDSLNLATAAAIALYVSRMPRRS